MQFFLEYQEVGESIEEVSSASELPAEPTLSASLLKDSALLSKSSCHSVQEGRSFYEYCLYSKLFNLFQRDSYFRHAALSDFVNFAIATVRNATNNIYGYYCQVFLRCCKVLRNISFR